MSKGHGRALEYRCTVHKQQPPSRKKHKDSAHSHHDPYLDLRDRDLILPDKARQRQVWKTVGNPGAVLLGGRVIGFWTVRTRGDKLDAAVTLFEALEPAQRSRLEELVSSYAAFRGTALRAYTVLSAQEIPRMRSTRRAASSSRGT